MKQSREPQEISEHVWYYENGRKLTFVVESAHLERSTTGTLATCAGTVQFNVPLRMLEKSLARSPRKRKR